MAARGKTVRNKLINIWMTEAEKEDLRQLADDLDLDMSKAIRRGLRLLKAEGNA